MKNLIACLLVLIPAGFASAESNEIKGFRYSTCVAQKCFSVISPVAWLSQSNGAFVASSREQELVKFRVVENGKVTREFEGSEVVSQPEINTMTIDSDRSVVLVDIEKNTYEVLSKESPLMKGRGQ